MATMVMGWFVRLALVFVIVAVGAFDGIAIAIASVGVKDDAQSAAQAAATAYLPTHDGNAAIAAAKADLNDGETLVPGSVRAAPDGTISLQVRRTARSIVFRYWSVTAQWDIVTGSASASPVTN